jgi:hypothetical protein
MNYRSKYTGKQIDDAVALAQTALQSVPEEYVTEEKLADYVTEEIAEVKSKTVYLSKSEYDNLVLAGNIDQETEYNVFEEQ